MEPVVKDAMDSGLLVTKTTQTEVLLVCEVCKCDLKGVVPAATHLRGSKHLKSYKKYLAKLSEENGTKILDDDKHRDHFIAENESPEIKALVENGTLEEFLNNGYLHFRCTVCNCDMSGTVPTKQHIDGNSHIKKFKSAQLCQSVASSSLLSSRQCSSTSIMNSRGSLADIDTLHSTPIKSSPAAPCFEPHNSNAPAATHVSGDSLCIEALSSGVLRSLTFMGAQHYECTVCSVQVTGEMPARTHLQGKSHRKGVARKALQCNTSKLVPTSSGSSLSSSDSRQANFAHVTDGVSAINLTPDDVMSALSTGVLERELLNGTESFKCTVCQSTSGMGGFATAASHLLGQKHLKAMARRNLFSGTPTVASSSPSSSDSGHDAFTRAVSEAVVTLETGGGYLCHVCKVSMTGVRSAEQHLIGGPHILRLAKWRESRNNTSDGSSIFHVSEINETSLNEVFQDAVKQYLLDKSTERTGEEPTPVTALIMRLNTKTGRSDLREWHTISVELCDKEVSFECLACGGLTVGQQLHHLAHHLLSKAHQRAVSDADTSTFHDASPDITATANSSRSSSSERVDEVPSKIVEIGLDDEVNWEV